MKRHRPLSIFLALFIFCSAFFTNTSYAASTKLLDERTTDEMLLSDLIYDNYILKVKKGQKIDITKYDKFYKKCLEYVERGDIMYQTVNDLKNQLSKYTLVKAVSDKKTGFKGAIFKSTYNKKSYYTVIFCGTEGPFLISKDWKNNFKEILFNSSQNQRPKARELLKEAIKYNPAYLSIAGHSLGGFLTESTAVDICQGKIKIPSKTKWKASTFNGAGIRIPDDYKKKGKSKSYENYDKIIYTKSNDYKKITNYMIDKDFTANVAAHVGNKVVYQNCDKSKVMSPTKYHSLFHFHKYGSWYTKPVVKLILRDIYYKDTYATGRALPNSKVYAFIKDKKVGETKASSTGYYKVKIPSNKRPLVGTNVKIICDNNKGKKLTKSTKIKSALEVNQIYYNDTLIKGKTYPYATVKVHKGKSKIGKEVKADKNGNFKIQVKESVVNNNSVLEVTASKSKYPEQHTGIKVLRKIDTLKVNKVYYKDRTISGKTIPGATVKAYYDKKQIGKSVNADKKGEFKITNVPTKPVGKTITIKASKLNYDTKEVSVKIQKKSVDYMSAYRKFMEKKSYFDDEYDESFLCIGGEKEQFFTKDIDNDGIKELIVTDVCTKYIKVYTYVNGSVKLCGSSYNRGSVFIDVSNRLQRRFHNSGEDTYYYLTLNSKKQLHEVYYSAEHNYTYDKYNQIDKKYTTYYKIVNIAGPTIYEEESREKISKSTFDSAVKKAAYKSNIVTYENNSSNRTKYLK